MCMTNTANPTSPTRKSFKWHDDRINGISRQLRGYQDMLEVARKYDLAFDVDRLAATVDEFEGELEDAMDAMLLDGHNPDRFA
jgi:hypothetical protein